MAATANNNNNSKTINMAIVLLLQLTKINQHAEGKRDRQNVKQ